MMTWKCDTCKQEIEEGSAIAVDVEFPIGKQHILCDECVPDIITLLRKHKLIKSVE